MSEFPKTLENFFLEDLIKDIDFKNKSSEFKNENLFEHFKENFNRTNSESSIENINNTSYMLSQNIITKEKIFSALSKQKTGILLQNIIKEMNNLEIENILKELKGNFSKLMKDKNGNYFCSDLIKLCSSKQRLIILKEIIPDFFFLSINQFANHSIQILIELIDSNEEIECFNLVYKNSEKLLNLSLSSNGSYVVQKIISNISEEKRLYLNELFLNNILILSCNMYGVVTLKKFIYYSKSILIYNSILFQIFQNFLKISEDPYGNYLIQYILDIWWERKEIVNIKNLIIYNFFRFSQNKFASHICEKYINKININEKNFLLYHLLKNGIFFLLLKDNYGVFVINKLVNDCLTNISLN